MIQILLADGFLRRAAAMPLVHALLWGSLAVLTVVLVILSRTRWAQNRPLQKCAFLSLIAHLLLACLAMTVRMVAGTGGMDSGPPIRVRLVNETEVPTVTMIEPASTPTEVVAPPPLFQPLPPAPVETTPQPPQELAAAEPADNVPKDEPPPNLVAAATNHDIAEVVELNAPVEATEPATVSDPAAEVADVVPESIPSSASPSVTDAKETTPAPVIQSEPSAPDAGAAAAYALRSDAGRLGLVESQGGSAQTEAAVAAALEWLAAAQSQDGRWDASQHGAGRELMVLEHNRNGAGRDADTGISALAILAFLGAGHTHAGGDYERTVERGLDFLLRSQAANGSLFGNAEHYAQMYCHSMATFALAEALAMTGDKRLESGVRQAIAYSLRAQHPSTGGWRYRIGDIGDTSQLGWQMMALASARRGGVDVPPPTWSGIERFLRSVRRGQSGGLASYRPESALPSAAMTAEAWYCRQLLGEITGGAIEDRAAAEATSQLIASLPNDRETNLYYWYYASLALHGRHAASEPARAAWITWNDALTSVLLPSQIADGPNAGSWDPNCLWGGYGGRVYSTALGAMCLEVYYRYAPAPAANNPWVATRPGE